MDGDVTAAAGRGGRRAWRAAAAVVLVACAQARAEFMVGCTAEQVLDSLGSPTRQIGTGEGELLIYGSVFVELRGGSVIFVNVGSREALDRRRAADAERGIYWGPGARPPREEAPLAGALSRDDGARPMTRIEQGDWLARRAEVRQRTLETRTRRFVLTRTFRLIFEQEALATLAAGMIPYRYAQCVTRLHLKDSRGQHVPACGEEGHVYDRGIDLDEALFAPGEPRLAL